ncbi:MAG: MMPL family transporter [Myxococcales bacterium]|nr:MMPL family transporter [Myxococcales bacterium]
MSQGTSPTRAWQSRVEAGFEAWGRLVFRHRFLAVACCLIVTGWLVARIPELTIDNSTDAFLLPDDPAVVVYNAFRDQFGRDDRLLVAVESDDLWTFEGLERIRSLHRAIEDEVPYVVEVESLLNARVTRGEADGLVVEELLEDWPDTQAELERIRAYATANPLYRNALLSADGRVAAIAIRPETYTTRGRAEALLEGFDGAEGGGAAAAVPKRRGGGPGPAFLTAEEGDELVAAMLALAERYRAPGVEVHLAGAPAVTYRINTGMTRDFRLLMPVTLLLMAVVLGVLFRRVGGVVLPLLVVLLSLVATLGTMVLLEIPGSTVVQILPVFLLTVGVCDAVHILAIVYRRRMEGEAPEDAVAHALGHAGLAVLMTSVTTAAGMLSFVTAEMAAVQHLGVLAPIGVALAFVYTLVLLPALLAIFPLPVPRRGRIANEGVFPLESFLVEVGRFSVRHPWRVLVPTAGLTAIAVLGALQTSFSHNGLKWFPQDDWLVTGAAAFDRALGGSVTLDVVFEGREAGAVQEPWLLHEMERLQGEIAGLARDPIVVGHAISIRDIVEETHQALNENRPGMRRIPETRQAIAQELLLFESSGSDDTEEWVDSTYRQARLNLRVPFTDALAFPPFLARVGEQVESRLAGRADYELTGLMPLLAKIFEQVISSMVRSYAFAIAVITPLMMLLLGSLRRGLVSMVPNLLPVVAVLGVMGWLSRPLDMTTMIVGAMVIGIAVDDTIHFMHKFHRYFQETGDIEFAVCETLRTTGSALLFTSLVLASGFAIFGLSEMKNIQTFGLLSAWAAVVALLADLLVAPALLALVEGWRRRRAQAAAQ